MNYKTGLSGTVKHSWCSSVHLTFAQNVKYYAHLHDVT